MEIWEHYISEYSTKSPAQDHEDGFAGIPIPGNKLRRIPLSKRPGFTPGLYAV
jgi:hypothetical protein